MDKYTNQFNREAILLSSLIKDNSLVDELIVSEQHFINANNKNIFIKIMSMNDTGIPFNKFTFSQLPDSEKQFLGGNSYIEKIIATKPFKDISYIQTEMTKFVAIQQAITMASEFINENFESNKIETFEDFMKDLNNIEIGSGDEETLQELILKEHERLMNMPIGLSGVSTGFNKIDKLFDGFQQSDLVIIGARPSVGKTALALDFIRNGAKKEDAHYTFFSAEMDKRQILGRMIAMEGGIEVFKMRNPNKYFANDDWNKYNMAQGIISKLHLEISGKKHLSDIKQTIRKTSKRYSGKYKCAFVIDHLGHIKTGRQFNSKHLEFTYIVNELKETAVHYNVPIILIVQLNRAVTKQNDKMPTMADIRESGSIEEIADMIMLLHREAYYDKANDDDVQDVQLIVDKNRNGFTGLIEMKFFPKTNRFWCEDKCHVFDTNNKKV